MDFAEQQYRAHIERQRRLGKIPQAQKPRPVVMEAPPLAPDSKPGISQAQIRMIAALQREVAVLSARLKAIVQDDQSRLAEPSRIEVVIEAVAKYYGLLPGDIVAFRRTPKLVLPRHVAMYLARKLTAQSLPAIGRVMARDHTTVMHGCRRIEKLRQENPNLDGQVRQLIEQLTSQPSGEGNE